MCAEAMCIRKQVFSCPSLTTQANAFRLCPLVLVSVILIGVAVHIGSLAQPLCTATKKTLSFTFDPRHLHFCDSHYRESFFLWSKANNCRCYVC